MMLLPICLIEFCRLAFFFSARVADISMCSFGRQTHGYKLYTPTFDRVTNRPTYSLAVCFLRPTRERVRHVYVHLQPDVELKLRFRRCSSLDYITFFTACKTVTWPTLSRYPASLAKRNVWDSQINERSKKKKRDTISTMTSSAIIA